MDNTFTITYRNPLNKDDTLTVVFDILDNALTPDWKKALKELLLDNAHLEKNYCMLGFPNTARNIKYLCNEVNKHIKIINDFGVSGNWQPPYVIEEYFCEESVRFNDSYIVGNAYTNPGLTVKHNIMNKLHNHFEILQGTVETISDYYKTATDEVRYSIRQLNLLCHELENVILAERKVVVDKQWIRPSQITTFINAPRHKLTDEHRTLFNINGYDRKLGGVYMHWCQIGKTLIEVYRDEHAPELTDAVCDAINHLQYYSGEFDIEWGNDILYKDNHAFHNDTIDGFYTWLTTQGFVPTDPALSLGYLPLAQARLRESMGITTAYDVSVLLGKYSDIYKISFDGVTQTYDYCWSDKDIKDKQLNILRNINND